MRIAVDGMGGDKAPDIVVRGVADALKLYPGVDIALVGHRDKLTPLMKQYGIDSSSNVELVHAEEVVHMHEPSTASIRTKKNSSITVAATLVSKGEADALVSAGHTGAAVAATKIKMRMLPGVDRPGIGIIIPANEGSFILVDAGANVDSKPINLAQFAIMGEAFARFAFSTLRPRIGLLSVGEEDSKGNELAKESFKILSKMPINFIGNVEGNILNDRCAEVVVCDGFVGNVMLKAYEGMAKVAMHWLKQSLTKNTFRKTSALLLKKAFMELKAIGDSEEYGGAHLLGVNGICIIGHGSSSPRAIRNAIRVAEESVRFGLNRHITRAIAEAEVGT